MSQFITVTINDVDLEVEFTGTPYVAATFNDPAEGGEIEINSICLNGNEISEMLAAWVVDDIEKKIPGVLASNSAQCEEDRAEAIAFDRLREAA